MKEHKEAGLWIRLSYAEREEIEREAAISGHNKSEIARQRMFSDPIAIIERRIDTLERRSLTQVAWLNLIAELIESAFPKDMQLGKKRMQARLNDLKEKVIRAENSINNDNKIESE